MVRAPPRVLPRSLAPSGVLGGGGVRSRFPPTWLGVVGVAVGRPRGGLPSTVARGVWGQALPLPRLPAHWAGCRGPRSLFFWARACRCGGPSLSPQPARPVGAARRGARPWRSCAKGRAGGGGRAPYPPFVQPGGACRAGGRSASFRPSAFPGQATNRVSLALCCQWGAWPPISLRFVLTRLLWVRFVRRPGALARARLYFAAPVGAGGWGGGAGRAPAPLSGGGGTIPPASGGEGRGPRGLRAGGGSRGGAVAPRPPCSPSGQRPAVLNPGPPRVVGALPSGVRVRSGSKCRPGVGGGEGRPVDRSPGGPCRPEPPLWPP